MKIWVIGRGYPTTSNKMWGSFELEQAKLLARNGHDVSYISLTLSFFDRKDPRGFRNFVEDNVSIYVYSHFYFPGKLGIYWEKFEDKCWSMLFEKAQETSGIPDVIHVHYPSMISSIHEIENYRNKNVKVFVTEHWSRVLINNLKKHEFDRLKYYGTHANCFACVSQLLMDAASELTDISVPKAIIPNLISPVFEPKKERKSAQEFVFVVVGRLVPIKQFDVVIKQFMSAFLGKDNVRLKIIGAGEAKVSLEKLAENCPQISFTGALKLEAVAKEISEADALISYSKYETFCVPVTEAWASGKPVIVSDKSGISPFVQEKYGMVVPFDKPEQLKSAMLDMYLNYNRYDADEISEYTKDNFSADAVYRMLIGMYEKY